MSLNFLPNASAQERDAASATETSDAADAAEDDDVELEVEVTSSPTAAPSAETEITSANPKGSSNEAEVKGPVQEPVAASAAPVAASAAPVAASAAPVFDGTAKSQEKPEQSAIQAEASAPVLTSSRSASSEVLVEPEHQSLHSGLNYRDAVPLGFQVGGFVQAQYQSSQLSDDQLDADGDSQNLNSFGVRRARLRLAHGWQYAFARLELDASTWGGAPVRIRRAEASVLYRANVPDDLAPPLVLTVGVTDVPFGAELAESQLDRLFMEQSLPSRALFPTPADLGIKLGGVYGAFDYTLAVVNGEPTGEDGFSLDTNSAKDFSGRVGTEVSPLESLLIAGGASVYVGTGFTPGVPGTKDSLQWVDVNNNGVAEPSEIQGVTGSSSLPSENYSRFAVALDARTNILLPIGSLLIGGEVFIASNMDRGVLPHDPIATGTNSRQFGASFFATQDVGEYFSAGFRGAYYDPNSNLVEQRAGVFHLKNQTFWELSPVIAVKIEHVRLSGQYDFILDHLGRDQSGVPADLSDNQWTLRLQVDL